MHKRTNQPDKTPIKFVYKQTDHSYSTSFVYSLETIKHNSQYSHVILNLYA